MASIAGQLIFHPKVNQCIKLGSSNLARDKLYRAIQYFARLYAWWLLSKGQKDQAVRWSNLKSHLGTARKLMRLGKPVESLQAALKAAISNNSAPIEQITMIARSLGYFGFLSLDSVVWAQNVKFLNLSQATAQKVAKISNQFWVVGILFSLLNSIAKAQRLIHEKRTLKGTQGSAEKDLAEEEATKAKLRGNTTARRALRSQMTMDLLDIWIPATGAGIVSVNEGFLGAFGMLTSVMALQKQWRAVG